MAKTICLYSKLKGIIPDQPPTEDFLKLLTAQETYQAVNHYFPDNGGGIVSTFWGLDLLNYSKIIRLDDLTEFQPGFEIQNGLIVPKIPLCGTSEDQTHIAMREILNQALTYLSGERKNKYFMITPYSGCCPFRSGKVEITLSEFEKKIKE